MPPSRVNSGKGGRSLASSRAEHPGIEGQRLQHPAGQRRARQVGQIVRMEGIGTQPHGGVLLEQADHLRPGGKKGVGQRVTQAIANRGLQIAARVGGVVAARRAVVGARNPDRARRDRRGAADDRRLLDQQHIQALHRRRQGCGHAAGAAAEHQQVDLARLAGAASHAALD